MEMTSRWSWVLGFAGVLLLVGGASSWYALGTTNGPATTLWIVGSILVVLWVAFDRQGLVDTVTTRRFALSSGSFGLQVVAFGLVAASYLIVAERFDKTFDLTGAGVHTLSDQTTKVLAGVNEPIEIVAFFNKGDPQGDSFSRLATLYDQASDQVSLTWIDPLANPVRAELDGVVGTTVLVRQGDREQRLEVDFTETNLTRRMTLVQDTDEHRICWARGHGEADPDSDTEPTGYGAIVLALEGSNYQVMHTTISGGIPRDCEVLVVVRPQTDWTPWEREALAAHVAEGRHAFILLDPLANTPAFNGDLERFHLGVDDNIVFDADPSANFPGMEGTLSLYDDRVLPHPITRGLGAAIVLPVARSVRYVVEDGIVVKDLLRTTTQAWGETDLESPDIGPDEGVDRIGSLPLAVLAEVVNPDVLAVIRPADAPPLDPEGPTAPGGSVAVDLEVDPGRLVPADFTPAAGGRIVLMGDADFASNQVMSLGNNQDFFLNVLAWMVGEEEQLGERPPTGEALEVSQLGSALICLVSVVFLPGGALVLALVTLVRRGWGGMTKKKDTPEPTVDA